MLAVLQTCLFAVAQQMKHLSNFGSNYIFNFLDIIPIFPACYCYCSLDTNMWVHDLCFRLL